MKHNYSITHYCSFVFPIIDRVGWIDNTCYSPIGHYIHFRKINKESYREWRIGDEGYLIFKLLKKLRIIVPKKTISQNRFGCDGKVHISQEPFWQFR